MNATVAATRPPVIPPSAVPYLNGACRASFRLYARRFWSQVPGAQRPIWNWHMDYICDQMQRAAERVFLGLPREEDHIYNVPPGTSKSTLASILFPTWVWTRMANARILSASHTDALVLDLATKARAVIKSELYQQCFPWVKLSEDQDTKGYYRNTLGGDRYTCTVAGKSPMGFHAHFIIVDDPIDPKKARSEAETLTAEEFVTQILPSRKVDKNVTVTFLIMQRLSFRDPTEVMLENAKKPDHPKVFHVKIPAELQDGPLPESLKDHYIDGLMDPVRLNRLALKEAYAQLGEYGYAGQYRQDPKPKSGGMFRPQYFSVRVKAAPFDCRRVRYWDRAATQDGGCFTAGTLLAQDSDGRFYIEHVEKGQWEPVERNQRMKAIALRDRNKYGQHAPRILVEREGGSSGRDAWLMVVRALAGFYVEEDTVTGSKETRAEPWSAQLAAGNVAMVEDGTWDINSYINEHCQFPLGKFKDQVDSSSGGFNRMVGVPSGSGQARTITYGGRKAKGLRILACTPDELPGVRVEERSLLYRVQLPHQGLRNGLVEDGDALVNCLGRVTVEFADITPEDYQDRWETPLEPFGKRPEELMMSRDDAKKLWALILKKRDPSPETVVICAPTDVAVSLSCGICDVLNQTRADNLYRTFAPDEAVGADHKPPNDHVYRMTRIGREMVV